MKQYLSESIDLMREWDSEENEKNGLDPTRLTFGSGKVAYWKCSKCGVKYKKKICEVSAGHMCRKCAFAEVSKKLSSPDNKKNRNSLTVADIPKLVAEWDFSKNKNILPRDVLANSERKVWWLCQSGHNYQAIPGNRYKLNSGCPYCSGKKVLKGFNDLETQSPEIAAFWNFEKNAPLLPSQITPNSEKYVWWICPKGHEWKARPNSLSNGQGCPQCSASIRTSFPEQAILFYLGKVFEVNSRKKIGKYEVDIYIPQINTAIEYDGIYFHSSEQARKREDVKDSFLKSNGITLYRVKETDTFLSDEQNIIYLDIRKDRYKQLDDAIRRLFMKLGAGSAFEFGISINSNGDKMEILSLYKSYEKRNNLRDTHPELVKQWNYEKNKNIKPEMYTKGSSERVWWKCSNDHEWEATIASRAAGAGCPYCSGLKKEKGTGDLLAKYPKLCEQWDYSKNIIRPDEVSPGSKEKIWWICKNGHSFLQSPNNRTSGKNGCPYCSNKKVLPGYNDLQTRFPEIAREWDTAKNGELRPTDVVFGSFKDVWWICSMGHSYHKRIIYRTRGSDSGCPICRKEKQKK